MTIALLAADTTVKTTHPTLGPRRRRSLLVISQTQKMDDLRCESCQDVIGVYEPMRVILRDGSERTGSRLTLRDELCQPGSVALHEPCPRPERPRAEEVYSGPESSPRTA